jgi:exopolysaccharide biosynthesis polyprenyl glycosylphosphotransferase
MVGADVDGDRASTGQEWAGLSAAQRYQSSFGGRTSAGTDGRRIGVMHSFRRRLMTSDAVIVVAVMLFGLFMSSRASTWAIDPLFAVYSMPFVIAALWMGLLILRGSYDYRTIGLGTEEIRRVVSATLYTFAVVAGVSYLIRADISRAYAFVSLPLGLLLIVGERFAWRGWLYRRRARSEFMHRTLIVGGGAASEELADRLARDSYAGYLVVAQYEAPEPGVVDLTPWLDGLELVLDAKAVEALAVAPSENLSSNVIRQLAWSIEGRSVDLLIAPAMMDIAGPRLSVRPAAGLPLLHLDEAVLSRSQRFTKRALDLAGAALLIVLLSPVMAICAVAVRVTSKGPAVFRQVRVGRGGRPFTMLKFRTMVQDADHLREGLRAEHDLDDPMFKLVEDPRITRAGKFLRRWSLDELPQLFNALGGSMSLVGPRPHPLDDVDRYELEAYRRLALKPGLTGLWQVEGRSDLDWAQALQLDLYYVETWSLSGDVVLLARTIRAVAQGRGAV